MANRMMRAVVLGWLVMPCVWAAGTAALMDKVSEDPNAFHFIVMGDRAGHEEKGVFGRILEKVNLMNPAFVVSVGDNIQGYNDSADVIWGQWDEFDGFIETLNVPFLRVPGNHDISSQMMADLYVKRYGPLYSHAVYKNVLFLFMNSDDPSAEIDFETKLALDTEKRRLQPLLDGKDMSIKMLLDAQRFEQKNRNSTGGQISDTQYAYFEKVLAENADVRWTFVVIHKPVWKKSEPPQNWLKLESLLAERPYTVFSGHDHRYAYTTRNGRDYIILCTSGGGGLPAGLPGVYQHLMWVSMAGQKPTLVSLLDDGILRKDDIRAALPAGGKPEGAAEAETVKSQQGIAP